MSAPTAPRLDSDLAFLRSRRQPALETQLGAPIGIVDLFCGCGGMTVGAIEGARRRGRPADVQLAIDDWTAALEVMEVSLGLEEERVQPMDLGECVGGLAEAPRLSEQTIIEQGAGAALLLAGPPCQGHSALNNHTRHDDPKNELYLAVARVARLTSPRAVIVENVRGVGRDRRKAVELCTAALGELDYRIASKTLDLHALGAPQRRVRHVLVATKDVPFEFDTLPSGERRDVGWAIGDLHGIDGATLMDTASVPTPENRRRIDWLFDHDAYDLPNEHRPPCHRSDHSYRSMYGRLRWDEPAQTITRGFGSMGQGRFVHPLARRTLTPHEAARLQFLPDFVDFHLVEQRADLATMIGNVAPPILTIALVDALIEQGLL